jgi:hypothetical protein
MLNCPICLRGACLHLLFSLCVVSTLVNTAHRWVEDPRLEQKTILAKKKKLRWRILRLRWSPPLKSSMHIEIESID